MRFNDVQDTRRPEVKKAQRNAAFRRMYDECLERLSACHSNRKMTSAFGATFTI